MLIHVSNLSDLIAEKIEEFVQSGETFTAKHVKDALRDDYPNVYLVQREVSRITADLFVNDPSLFVGYDVEPRFYDNGQGGQVVAQTYFPQTSKPPTIQGTLPSAWAAQPTQPQTPVPPVPSQKSTFGSRITVIFGKKGN